MKLLEATRRRSAGSSALAETGAEEKLRGRHVDLGRERRNVRILGDDKDPDDIGAAILVEAFSSTSWQDHVQT